MQVSGNGYMLLILIFLLNFIIVGGQNLVVLRETFWLSLLIKSAECLL